MKAWLGLACSEKTRLDDPYRRGSISLAVSQEPNLALIKIQSDHSSEAVWSYIELEESRRRSIARLMVEAFDRAGAQAADQ